MFTRFTAFALVIIGSIFLTQAPLQAEPPEKDSAYDITSGLSAYEERGRLIGYHPPEAFTAFLKQADNDAGATPPSAPVEEEASRLSGLSLWGIFAFLFLGGIALNLTPCMLPMIPINAVLITGMSLEGRRENRFRSAALGGVYALGLMLTFGTLGLLALLFKTPFGLLNSSPWFSLIIGVIFLFFGLAMGEFWGLTLDFSRFGNRFRSLKGGAFIPVFFLGIVSALLSGACVAPIIGTVLLLGTEHYAQGNQAALLYPFMLGFGMGLPWIFVGAGLSFLPKTGQWMVTLKRVFAVLVLLIGAYYLFTGVMRFFPAEKQAAAGESTPDLISEARRTHKPLLLHFSASWCGACAKMKSDTLRNPEVKNALKNVSEVHMDVENPRAPDTRRQLEHFNVQGMPTYILLTPKHSHKQGD